VSSRLLLSLTQLADLLLHPLVLPEGAQLFIQGRGWAQQGNECRRFLIPDVENWTKTPISLLSHNSSLPL